MTTDALPSLLENCRAARESFFDARHVTAFRLFNGFSEGEPDLVVDLYAATAVISNYADPPDKGGLSVKQAQEFLRTRLPWLRTAILKTRNSKSSRERRGVLLYGDQPDRRIREHGIWYAVDLTINQDASFYLDTRNLRRWALEHLRDRTVLNAFAYTGSLGVAARAAGARRVIQLDRNRRFLSLGKTSCTLNGFPVLPGEFIEADFFRRTAQYRRSAERFDCVFVDPPLFASSSTGMIDQINGSARILNKVRPLVSDWGVLVAVNNALYVSGADYMHTLTTLCQDGYLEIAELIPVPEDVVGYGVIGIGAPVADPRPFNHSTKIAILRVSRKAKPIS